MCATQNSFLNFFLKQCRVTFFPFLSKVTTDEAQPFSPGKITIVELTFLCKELFFDLLNPIALDVFLSDPYHSHTNKT